MKIQKGYDISEEERNAVVPSSTQRRTSKEIHSAAEAKRKAEMLGFMEEIETEGKAMAPMSSLKSSESETASIADSGAAEEPAVLGAGSADLPILPTCQPGYILANVHTDDGEEFVDCVSISILPNVSVRFKRLSLQGYNNYLLPEIDKLGGTAIFDSVKSRGTATVLAEDEHALRELLISWCEIDEER